MININSIDVGQYYYRMPHWDNWLLVDVIRTEYGKLAICFKKGYYPTLLTDLPFDAELIHYDDFECDSRMNSGYIFYIPIVGLIFIVLGYFQYRLTSHVSVVTLSVLCSIALVIPILMFEYNVKTNSKKVS